MPPKRQAVNHLLTNFLYDEIMSRPVNQNLQLHVTSSAKFLAYLRSLQPSQNSHAIENYLLCKCAIKKRRQEIEEARARGLNVANLERIIARLEASLEAHKKVMRRGIDDA